MSTQKNIDDKILELFEIVKKQKIEVENTEKSSKKNWLTTCSFHSPFLSSPVNLQVASEKIVINCLSQLLILKKSHDEACDILNIKNEFTLDNFTYSQWVEDFQKRISHLRLKEEKNKLSKLEERLNSIVSPEQKRQMELDEISKILNV